MRKCTQLNLLFYSNQQNKLGAKEEVQALCDVNLISSVQSICLLSSFLLHLNCSKVNDVHFLAKSNNVSLIHFILTFLLPLVPSPNYSLDFLFLMSSSTALLPFFPFLPLLPFLISSLLAPSVPINPGVHQISVCFVCIVMSM